ncbi:uncharacterized protein B0P05DRAFT_543960 [Gilbertella persicaria]|uniref:uncharacterized protein n=1 Tax=Gilbertella persicaria TaxID=101096 RepID=UPI00221F092F|nr:uncharacterized protein B0P05DRAFT_543960 [Gilbertella persicaria]KAI8078068.1 hypothetical protein B0P05DRAFT_543960 [Gilbertella persicaria]
MNNNTMNQKEKEISLMANTTTHRKSVGDVQVDIPDEAPMAVLPLNSSSKLDQEPNPFEQSFSGATPTNEEKSKDKLTLPPVASITSTAPLVNHSVIGGGILPKEVSNQFTWDTLRTGPLSPSMLQGPANPEEYYATANMPSKLNNNYPAASSSSISRASFSSTGEVSYPVKIEQSQDVYLHPTAKPPSPPTRQSTRTRQTRKRSSSSSHHHQEEDAQSMDSSEYVPHKKTTRRRSSALTQDSDEEDEEQQHEKTTSRKKKSVNKDEDDEKRKNFLERNRIAALKCRQRKKQWLNNLQAKVEFLTNDNERLQMQSESLKEEIVNLKTLLLAHKECPIAQAHGFHSNAIQKASMSSVLSTPIMRQSTSSSMMMQPYLNNRTSTSNPSLPQQQGSSGNSVAASSSSSSSIPQYQRTSTANIGMPIQSQPAGQQGMVAGGSSGVLRF